MTTYPQGHVLVGVRIRTLRIARGLSVSELAKRAGLRRTHLSAIEHGRKGLPTLTTVVYVAGALDVEPWEIVAALSEAS